jgi:predicted metal-dependent phosphoesterase TrpH
MTMSDPENKLRSAKKLKADLHIHTAEDPCDHIPYTAYKLIDTAAELGFEVLSVTNHTALTFDRKLESYAGRQNILLIPGTEIMASNAHVLIVNPAMQTIRSRYDLAEIPRLKADQSLFIAPHPFFFLARSLQARLFSLLPYFDALEFTSYYHALINRNKKALRTAALYNKPIIANSDAHNLWQIGKTYSLIEANKDIPSIIEAVKEGRLEIRTSPFSTVQIGWAFMKAVTFDRIWHTLKL